MLAMCCAVWAPMGGLVTMPEWENVLVPPGNRVAQGGNSVERTGHKAGSPWPPNRDRARLSKPPRLQNLTQS